VPSASSLYSDLLTPHGQNIRYDEGLFKVLMRLPIGFFRVFRCILALLEAVA
jgi:hypothetical protein